MRRKYFDLKRVQVSLATDVKQWPEETAQFNAASISSEIVRSLRIEVKGAKDRIVNGSRS
jgi:hypothetical protein